MHRGADAVALSECSCAHTHSNLMIVASPKRCDVLVGGAHNTVASDSKFGASFDFGECSFATTHVVARFLANGFLMRRKCVR